MAKKQSTPALPPGTEGMYSVTCKDVVMGRGSGTQNHCGNITYRKLVYLNKELYATSSKFDKLKISKAIVAAVRHFGGHFVQADDKRGGLYFDIGDKRAWDKTSQALREGQTEIRAQLAEEDPTGMEKIAEYKQVISEQTFFAYACKMMESLYHPANALPCGQQCIHAQRRETLHQIGADPMVIHDAMQSLSPPTLPPPQIAQQQQQRGHAQQGQPWDIEPLPYKPPAAGGDLEPLPYAPNGAPAPNFVSGQAAVNSYQDSWEPLPYNQSPGLQKAAAPFSSVTSASSGGGSVFSLRKFCSEDIEMSSEEGKALMVQLNQEVDDLIRRKSYGLIQIDTTPFHELVFEEDSMELDGPAEEGNRPSTSSSSGKNSHQSRNSSESRGLSFKDDMSLMNMSILTLDEKEVRGNSINMGGDVPKSIVKQNDGLPANMRKRDTRVSFAGGTLMDERTFSQLVDSISDPDSKDSTAPERGLSELSIDSQRSLSRKVGFPMRQKVAEKFGAEVPPPDEVGRPKSGSRMDKVSTLTIQEDFPHRVTEESGPKSDFSKMAGQVSNPGVGNSLKLDVSISNVSQLKMSNMSLASDIDPELLS